ncbi:MAG: glycosyltransferase [Chloroflexi bacterium]|nr:MAG: glycosyltransferase [Chloroflexota bacterium]
MLDALSGGLTLLSGSLLGMTAYLDALTVAAAIRSRRPTRPTDASPRHRFAVLVPAHNEELLIGRLLDNLQQLDYPSDLYEVCVVADNCTDRTAELARAAGAKVYERFDPTQRAKGYALRWLLEQLGTNERTSEPENARTKPFDAFVILDADSVVSRNFLRSMDARLASGAQVIQAHYSVLNADEGSVAGLRSAALAAVHYLRPLGRAALGLSCGLKGNGMCFAAEILERFAWSWFTLAEDVEFHLALVSQGVRVDFAPEATVLADMPLTLEQAASQNDRWERGRLQLVKHYLPRLVLDSLRHRSPLRFDAAVEQLIPPLSIPFALSCVMLVAALALALAGHGGTLPLALAACSLVGQVAYLLAALALVRAPRSRYVSLGKAPIYIAWKVSLYARALLPTRGSEWVRTARAP